MTDADLIEAAASARELELQTGDDIFAGRLLLASVLRPMQQSELEIVDLSQPGALEAAPNARLLLARAWRVGLRCPLKE